MSPTSTARHRPTARKVALCAAALVVTILPSACGAAYADSGADPSEVVEVGGADAAGAEDGDDAGTDDDNANGTEEGADEGSDDANEADGAEEAGDNGGDNADDEAGDKAEEQQAAKESDNGDNGNGGNNGGGDNGGGDNGGGDNGGGDNVNGNGGGNGGGDNGLDVLGTDCSNSDLEPHNGLEEAPRCVDTSFGEVASEDKSPSLLITESPDTVRADEEFEMTVSTRNLVRDRFLGAADGGYYKESSFLNGEGLQRGHFHTACRMLESTDTAPDAAPEPEFFLATEDGGGGAAPDQVKINVSGLPSGTAQCAVWAGDGSHRVPMMQRANQIPAFDIVRITVE